MGESLAALGNGFLVALTPMHLLWCLAGVALGTAVGVLPGIGPALTVSLLLPITYSVEPTAAFIMFAGIYYGAMYGGSTTSILLNTPGETATIVTALEGNAMARAGRGGAALATSAIGSFVAGTLATAGLVLLAQPAVALALMLGPAEYFALIVAAFAIVTGTLGDSRVRGLASLGVGLTLGLVGLDPRDGQARLTFGSRYLLDGIDPIIAAVGLFAVGEAIYAAWLGAAAGERVPLKGSLLMTREEWRRSWKPWLRGTAIGFPMGVIPAGGSELPTLMSYAAERRLSSHQDEWGRGAIEGVAGPEAANNAAAAGTLVPLLTLGLPTSATAAMLLAAFQQYGLKPGPLLFSDEPSLVWGMIASLFVGNALLLALNLPLVGIWVRLLRVPQPYLHAGILVLASVGAYSVHGSAADLIALAAVGVIGFALRLRDFPLAPVVIGLLLGPMAELQLTRALAVGDGGWRSVLGRPGAATILTLGLLVAVAPAAVNALRRAPEQERSPTRP
ncbi:MAG: tripartite tricarboxylate transporter permease [Gemmatimonadetes bacterium]|nr:tripartite tricarboxylate transporter permease [Gemmatimonadota bacterium]